MLRTKKEAAERLNITVSQVERLIKTGRINAINIGTEARENWRISDPAIEAFENSADNVDAKPSKYTPVPSIFAKSK